MNELQQEQRATFIEALGDGGVPVSIEGASTARGTSDPLLCMLRFNGGNMENEDGGFVVDGSVTARFLVDHLPDPMPTYKATIEIDGRKYVTTDYSRKPGSAVVQYFAELP